MFFPGFELRSPSLSSKHLIYLLSYLTSPSCQLLQIPSIKSLGNTDDQAFTLLFSFYFCLKKKTNNSDKIRNRFRSGGDAEGSLDKIG